MFKSRRKLRNQPVAHLLQKPSEKFTFCNTFTCLCQRNINYLSYRKVCHNFSGKAACFHIPNIELQRGDPKSVIQSINQSISQSLRCACIRGDKNKSLEILTGTAQVPRCQQTAPALLDATRGYRLVG